MRSFDLFLPTRIVFGPGRLDALETTDHIPEGARTMIVIGAAGAMQREGYLARVQGLLAARGIRSLLYDRIRGIPETAQIDKAAERARAKAVDFVVGLGGGSSIDAAKAIALLARNPGRCRDYLDGGCRDGKTPGQTPLPVVAIPTTAGSGAETAPHCVIARSAKGARREWRHPSLAPHLAVVDPDLTLSVPADMTALAGVVAFFNAVGALLATTRQPAADLLALEAVQIVARYLPRVVANGGDREARRLLMWAGTAAGMSASLASGLSLQSLARALGSRLPELSHGAALTILAPAYFGWLEKVCSERFDLIAAAMASAADDLDTEGAVGFRDVLIELIRACGLGSAPVAARGVSAVQAAEIARTALDDMGRHFDATPVSMRPADAETILTAALSQ